MEEPTITRKIHSLLVPNRGEIAQRILQAARELSLTTYALTTPNDTSHAKHATHTIALPSPAVYLDIDLLISICKEHRIDAVHPGYGFLSESAELAKRMWDEARVMVVGPGAALLARTGDKIKARELAVECGVPVLPALGRPTRDVAALKAFAAEVGFPIMIKAVDGGGGRGIRLVRGGEELDGAARRAIEESPSKLVFAEKAAVDGFLHVEVQIVGDGKGGVVHAFERQCSIQRRYQKVVEVAPCVGTLDRRLIAKVIDAAVRMAQKVNYFSLGTFEFLAGPADQFYFLEVNPRLQVEHTITESICNIDLVRAQLLIAQGASFSSAGLSSIPKDPLNPPPTYSCQLRVTAESVSNNWALSTGKVQSFKLPCGNGIRVDTALETGQAIGSDFDSLLAKIIITAPSWSIVVQKAQRALADIYITGVKTNLNILRGIVAHPEFASRDCDTRWLEENQEQLLQLGERVGKAIPAPESNELASTSVGALAAPLFRKGDAWTVNLTPLDSKAATSMANHLQITRVLRNDFPASLVADVNFTDPSGTSQPFKLELASTSASASAVTSHHRRGDPANPNHIIFPFPGKLVEVLVDEGDVIKPEDVVCVVQQMKMEIEIRAKKGGKVVWVTEAEDGEDVNEGLLAAEIVEVGDGKLAKL